MEIGNVSVHIAFAAGLVSILSPCVLPHIPMYLAYLTGSTAGELESDGGSRTAVWHSVAFTSGFGVIFIILGISVGLVGWVLRDNMDISEGLLGEALE